MVRLLYTNCIFHHYVWWGIGLLFPEKLSHKMKRHNKVTVSSLLIILMPWSNVLLKGVMSSCGGSETCLLDFFRFALVCWPWRYYTNHPLCPLIPSCDEGQHRLVVLDLCLSYLCTLASWWAVKQCVKTEFYYWAFSKCGAIELPDHFWPYSVLFKIR